MSKRKKKAAEAAAAGAAAVSDKVRPAKRKKRRLGRKLLLVLVAAGIALAVSEPARKKALDALFGAEEEFDYTSTTTPPTPAPDTVAA